MATTHNFSLRKLIQTQLYTEDSDEESRSSNEHTGSYFEHDDNRKIKKRISSWLLSRKQPTAAPPRSSLHGPRAPSPLASVIRKEQPARESDSSLQVRSIKRRTLDSHASDAGDLLEVQHRRPPRPSRPTTYSSTYFSHRYSTSLGSNYSVDMESRPSHDVGRPSAEWSDGVKQLMMETEQAFKAVGNEIDEVSHRYGLPKIQLSVHEHSENFKFPMSEEPVNSIRYSRSFDLPKIEESPVSPTQQVGRFSTPNLRPSTPSEYGQGRDSMDWRSERRSSSVYTFDSSPRRRTSRSLPPRRPSLTPSTHDQRPTTPSPLTTSQEVNNSNNTTPPLSRYNRNSHKHSNSNDSTHSQQSRASSRKLTRWGLGEGFADILTGQRFKKLQADEMLTDEQFERLKGQRDETRRIICHGKNFSDPFGEVRAPSPLFKSRSSGFGEGTVSFAPETYHDESDYDDEGLMTIDRLSIVTPAETPIPGLPRRSSRRRTLNCSISSVGSSSSHFPGLRLRDSYQPERVLTPPQGSPCFSEVSTVPSLPPKNTKRFTRAPMISLPKIPKTTSQRCKAVNPLLPSEDDENLYFFSTPYSLNHPQFRQGRISFAKSEMHRGALAMEDTLDWTAFQMAILGAGDFMMPESFDEEREEARPEDLIEWFNSFGFDNCGELVPEPIPSSRSSSGSTVSSASSEDSPIPTSTEHWGYGTTKFFQGHVMRQWSPEGQKTSPQEPRVMGEDDVTKNDDGEHVQMGFNLHDDLGDFLKWEADHAFGGGFYGNS